MFRLFGFQVRVDIGFIIFVGLIAMLYQSQFGLWLAAALTVFTLIHEFGHAVVARHFGAHAEISLGFMAGYTSYATPPGTTITPLRRAAISLAGPMVQIVVSVIVLAIMGLSPIARPPAGSTDLEVATWWAGPVIGVLNLIPVLPLDGGHLVQNVLASLLKRPVLRPMAIASLALTAGVAIWMYASGRRGFTFFIVFLLFSQFQIVQATMNPTRKQRS